MPVSYSYFKEEVVDWFLSNVATSKRILDVGPGVGTYSDLLRKYGYKMDAIEIWAPYISKYQLPEKYDSVFNGNIVDFDLSNYDFIILGDVLEHLTSEQGVELIDRIKRSGKECLVAVPFLMDQGEHDGNKYEAHLQPDLLPEIMNSRYPSLTLLMSNPSYGYYTMINNRVKKAFVLYATESYFNTVQGCVYSLNKVSNIPVFVYMLNSNLQVEGATTINWKCSAENIPQKEYVDRDDPKLYKIMIERPAIVIDALRRYADVVAYVDSDSVATNDAPKIFDMMEADSSFPYFVEGIYDFLQQGSRGAAETINDLPNTLEHELCELLNVDQSLRINRRYRQTGYFVAGVLSIPFLEEWYWMCNHPAVLNDPRRYAPFHEETVLNVLMWKKKIFTGLPYIYINSQAEDIDKIPFYEKNVFVREWVKTPEEGNLLFIHGEKDKEKMIMMSKKISKKLKILFIAPHLSTGGMPAFLLKRIEALQNFNVEVSVVEFSNYSDEYVVQKRKIKELCNIYSLKEDKKSLISIVRVLQPDIIHVDEMIEGFDSFNKVPIEIMNFLYSPDRTWRMVETCHNIIFNPDIEKVYHPDGYAFCTPYHLKTFKNMSGKKAVINYPIENKVPSVYMKDQAKVDLGFDRGIIHVLNVGLWTPGKNQKEGLEIARKNPDVHFHFVGNQAVNFKDYWEPLMKDLPKNVTVWGEMYDVPKFMQAADIFMFNSTFECNPIVLREAISYGLPILAHNLPQYMEMFDDYIHPVDTNINALLKKQLPVNNDTLLEFGRKHFDFYNSLFNVPVQKIPVKIIQHFVDGPYIEILGNSTSKFTVQFIDEMGAVHYESVINSNSWARVNRKYFTKWRTVVKENDVVIYDSMLDLKGKRVFISIESSALGDTIAWMPYVVKFQEEHQCKVIVCTFKNFLFKSVYPELEFVSPGETVHNLYALYRIGWFYDGDKEPERPITIPLQKAATNILGLPFEELAPKIIKPKIKKDKKKLVTIATNSTAGCKFWTQAEWQRLVDHLVEKGYRVLNVSIEPYPLDHVTQFKKTSLEDAMKAIYVSEFFIGLSSGLSWLAWALGTKVVMIANFSEEDHEFMTNCIRVTNKSVCHGCWNNPAYTFDKGDWNWCPVHKGTYRQFECHTSIRAIDVLSEIEKNGLI